MAPDEPKDQDWQAALAQAEVLRRLPSRPSAAEIADAMADLLVSRATLFRRLRRFRAEGRASALVAGKAGRRLGVDPFGSELKSIVDQNIATFVSRAPCGRRTDGKGRAAPGAEMVRQNGRVVRIPPRRSFPLWRNVSH